MTEDFLSSERGGVIVYDETETFQAVEELDDTSPPLRFLQLDVRRRAGMNRRLHDLVGLETPRLRLLGKSLLGLGLLVLRLWVGRV